MMAAALATAALAFAGCGGDGDKAPSGSGAAVTGATQTKAQYIAKADAICRDTQKQIDPIQAALDKLPKDSKGRATTRRLAPLLERALEVTSGGYKRLRALPAPAQDKAMLESWLSSTGDSLDLLAAVQSAVKANDRKQAQRPGNRIDTLSAEQRSLAQAYGFKACLSGAATD